MNEPWRGDPIPALRRTLGFSCFTVTEEGSDGVAAATFAEFNPLYQLGRLPSTAPLPTPRHVPLVLPSEQSQPFYCYRRVTLADSKALQMLIFPSTNVVQRPRSFEIIDRLVGLLSPKPDPYWRPRAKVLSQRALAPVVSGWLNRHQDKRQGKNLRILDVGAGTGHLTAEAWKVLHRSLSSTSIRATIHFVDSSGPDSGRSFGLSGLKNNIDQVEWTRADYRQFLDDDGWLSSNGPYDLAVFCRILCNLSNFSIEPVKIKHTDEPGAGERADPLKCLSPRRRPSSVDDLSVQTVRLVTAAGTTMPQLSLVGYFRALRSVLLNNLDRRNEARPFLPVRKLNPACLTTRSGRSIIEQTLKVARVIVVEDIDVRPEHLQTHRMQFGLPGTGCLHLTGDGFRTEANHFIIGGPRDIERLKGERLW